MNKVKKDLFLVLSSKAFEVTGTHEKMYELRERTDWIVSRLLNKDGSEKHYDTITLQLGYGKNAPRKKFNFIQFRNVEPGTNFGFSNGLEYTMKSYGFCIFFEKINK